MESSLNNKVHLPVPPSLIERRIYLIRGQEVILDSDLAELYQVGTKALNQAVKRNLDRFPVDFAFRFNKLESVNIKPQFITSDVPDMRSQIVTASKRNMRHCPYAFTEHGVAMLSSVLKSQRAAQMNILIIRAFIKMRQLLAANADLSKRLNKVEDLQKLHHQGLTGVAQDIKKLKNPRKTNLAGFRVN